MPLPGRDQETCAAGKKDKTGKTIGAPLSAFGPYGFPSLPKLSFIFREMFVPYPLFPSAGTAGFFSQYLL